MGRSQGAQGPTGAKGGKGPTGAKGGKGPTGAKGRKGTTGARPSRAPGRTRVAAPVPVPAPVPAGPASPADQAPPDSDPGSARIRAKRKGGLGDLGKLAWQKNLPELSLLDEATGRPRLSDDGRSAAQALPPKTPAAQARTKDLPPAPGPVDGQGPGTIPPNALSFLKEELSAILALCQD